MLQNKHKESIFCLWNVRYLHSEMGTFLYSSKILIVFCLCLSYVYKLLYILVCLFSRSKEKRWAIRFKVNYFVIAKTSILSMSWSVWKIIDNFVFYAIRFIVFLFVCLFWPLKFLANWTKKKQQIDIINFGLIFAIVFVFIFVDFPNFLLLL